MFNIVIWVYKVFVKMDYGYESDDLEDFIRPTKKNRRILIGFYIFIALMICVLSYIQLVTAEYANVVYWYCFLYVGH